MIEGIVGAVAALVAIANPLGALPVYFATRDPADGLRHRAEAWRAALAVGLGLGVCAVAGSEILAAFGVRVAGLRAAGGLIITFMAFSMVQGERSPAQHSRGDDRAASRQEQDLSIYVPLSIPLIAGPGAITTAIALGATPSVGVSSTLVAVAVVAGLTWATFFFARTWHRVLGDFGVRLLTRLLGLLVMAVGVQMIVSGVKELWTS